MTERNYKQVYESYFKNLVEDENGNLIKDAVMRELSDYDQFMETAAKVYCHVTDGRISKINTLPEVIISVANDVFTEQLQEALKDELEALRD